MKEAKEFIFLIAETIEYAMKAEFKGLHPVFVPFKDVKLALDRAILSLNLFSMAYFQKPMAKVASVYSFQGDTGKTNTTAIMAAAIAASGDRAATVGMNIPFSESVAC